VTANFQKCLLWFYFTISCDILIPKNSKQKGSTYLSQRKGVWHQVHPLLVRVGDAEVGDGEGEGGGQQVDGVHHGQSQE
jgi:hypothetical protein